MTRITYKKEPCSRCSGSGEYSYCQTYGTTCFKCQGSGKQLTKAARKAKAAIERQLATYHRKASDLMPGLYVDLNTGSRVRWQKIASVEPSSSRYLDKATGQWLPFIAITPTKGTGLHTSANTEIKVRFTAEQWRDEIMPLARTLAGVDVTETAAVRRIYVTA